MKKGKPLPKILPKRDIEAMINATHNLKHRLLIELLYGSGLRVSEAVNMKLEDLFLREKYAFVRKGKRNKDRLVILSKRFVDDARTYLKKRGRCYRILALRARRMLYRSYVSSSNLSRGL